MRGLSPQLEVAVLTFVFGLIFGCQMRGAIDSPDSTPMADWERQCEEAWVAEYDGDPETEPESAILDDPTCQTHNRMTVQTDQLEEQNELQEQMDQVAP